MLRGLEEEAAATVGHKVHQLTSSIVRPCISRIISENYTVLLSTGTP